MTECPTTPISLSNPDSRRNLRRDGKIQILRRNSRISIIYIADSDSMYLYYKLMMYKVLTKIENSMNSTIQV